MNDKTKTRDATRAADSTAEERPEDSKQNAPAGGEAGTETPGDAETPDAGSVGPRGGTSEAGEAGVSPTPEEVEALSKLAAERDVYLDELRRSKAEFENFRKRIRRERPGWEAQAVRRLVQDLLPVIDNFERALDIDDHATVESFREGVAMIVELARKTLAEHDVREIEAAGSRFDPHFHDAVAQIPVEDPAGDGRVVEVLEKGYLHGDVVVRPSRVVVGKATSSGADETAGAQAEPGDAAADRSTEEAEIGDSERGEDDRG